MQEIWHIDFYPKLAASPLSRGNEKDSAYSTYQLILFPVRRNRSRTDLSISERISRLESQLSSSWNGILEFLPPDGYIGILDSVPAFTTYNQIPGELANRCENIRLRYGMPALETLHKLAIACLISHFETRTHGSPLPPLVLDLFRQEHERILNEMNSNAPGFYSLANDLFLKDLGIARTLLTPVGINSVQLVRGVPRSILWRGGWRQFASALVLFLKIPGGYGPFFEIHMDIRRRAEFTPEKRSSCFRTVAELLRVNERVRGLLAGSWLHDPALENINPSLGHLRREALKSGGKLFYYADEGETSGALQFSPSRWRLFDKGLYRPKTYFVVWPRKCLLRWAGAHGRSCHYG